MNIEEPSALSVAILRAVLYADLFDFPINISEIRQQLVLQRASDDEVRSLLQSCPWLQDRVDC